VKLTELMRRRRAVLEYIMMDERVVIARWVN
jgi:hypothetical protein